MLPGAIVWGLGCFQSVAASYCRSVCIRCKGVFCVHVVVQYQSVCDTFLHSCSVGLGGIGSVLDTAGVPQVLHVLHLVDCGLDGRGHPLTHTDTAVVLTLVTAQSGVQRGGINRAEPLGVCAYQSGKAV